MYTKLYIKISATKPPGPLPPPVPPPTCVCPDSSIIYEGDEGIVQSPTYPDKYCNNLRCKYHIRTPPNTIAYVKIYGETWKGFDYLNVYGTTEGTLRLVKLPYCYLLFMCNFRDIFMVCSFRVVFTASVLFGYKILCSAVCSAVIYFGIKSCDLNHNWKLLSLATSSCCL